MSRTLTEQTGTAHAEAPGTGAHPATGGESPARSAPLPGGPWLVCRARALLCALPVARVIETMRPLPVEPLAGAPPFVRGLSIIRGAPVPVVDAGSLLGAGGGERWTRYVALRCGERRVALAVEEVVGVRTLSPEVLGDLPPLLDAAGAEIVSRVGTLDARLLLVLQEARLVPDSVWRSLEASGVPA